jgi:hypothetical protein
MSLRAVFPYDPGKILTRGMRIGFVDAENAFQPFEIRKVTTIEPDHYQDIVAEHIAIAELSDEHLAKAELTGQDAASALTQILQGTQWELGYSAAQGISDADISMGSVWQGVRAIEQNWNVYITPRVDFSTTGITARYLNIDLAAPSWGGLRLSLDKNADEVGVTWDDTGTITAIYGYGANVENGDGDDTEILTLANAVWAETAEHPAKPRGQLYLEDPAAKALYGRNGRNRFGYYQNSEITDAQVLLEKSWEALKNSSAPDVSIDCQVRDLYRLGYDDAPIRLHGSVIIEIRPTGEKLQREIIRLSVDLLDPTATRVTIGKYIPSIVYMQRQTQKAATGSGGGGRHGLKGNDDADGQDNRNYEFRTSIQASEFQIALHAEQLATDGSILAQAGLTLDSSGVLIYADNNPNMIGAKLKVQADQIALVVTGTGTNAQVNAASIVAGINASGSSVTISADKIVLSGETVAEAISSDRARFNNLVSGNTYAQFLRAYSFSIAPETGGGGGSLSVATGAYMIYHQHTVDWKTMSFVDGTGTYIEFDYLGMR